MIKTFLIWGIVIAALGFVAYQVLQFFFSIQVSSSKLKKDLAELKIKLSDIKIDLAPIDQDSLKLLSYDKEEDFIKDKVSIYKEGVFTSIYHEPMIAYVYKQYIGRMDKAILLVETLDQTYEYYISDKSTRVMKDGELFGTIYSDGLFKNKNGDNLISIEIEDKKLLNIKSNGKEPIAMLNNPSLESTGLSRAFEFLDTDVSIENESIIILSSLLAVQAEA